MKHDYLTVVSVYGHNDGSSSLPSLLRTTAALPGSRGLLLSINKPSTLPANIAWKRIPPLTYQQYSFFMMYCLESFIETEFVLSVQDDGWALNKDAWTEDFLSYDYIGAPTAIGLVSPSQESDLGYRFNGKLLREDFQWIQEENKIGVLNGGFSLRSKKFLSAPRKIGLPYIFEDNLIRQSEDVQLCIFFRAELINYGIHFANLDVAKKFAFTNWLPNLDGSFSGHYDLENIFGIHGSYMHLVGLNQVHFDQNQNSPFIDYYQRHLEPHLRKMGYELI